MPLTKEIAIDQIRTAFREIRLGKGIGLFEAQAIDGGMDEVTQKAYRAQDETEDWEAIPIEKLDRYYASLSFFDAEGMRFHLPAYLIANLLGSLTTATPYFYITHLETNDYLSDYSRSKLALFSKEQRAAVRDYLMLVRDLPNFEFSRPEIDSALQGYWAKERTDIP
jgi:hypothetical protein